MGDVRPFCGLRYNLQRITDPSTVITPPYDVISPEERSLYYRRSPYNIIRLDSTSSNTASHIGTWIKAVGGSSPEYGSRISRVARFAPMRQPQESPQLTDSTC